MTARAKKCTTKLAGNSNVTGVTMSHLAEEACLRDYYHLESMLRAKIHYYSSSICVYIEQFGDGCPIQGDESMGQNLVAVTLVISMRWLQALRTPRIREYKIGQRLKEIDRIQMKAEKHVFHRY